MLKILRESSTNSSNIPCQADQQESDENCDEDGDQDDELKDFSQLLISEVQSLPVLWNKDSSEYK